MKRKKGIAGIVILIGLCIFLACRIGTRPKEEKAEKNSILAVYEEAYKNHTGNGKSIWKMMKIMEKTGHAVVDTRNHYNMLNPEKLEPFLKEAKRGETKEAELIQVLLDGRIIHFRFASKDKSLLVTQSNISMNAKGQVQERQIGKFHTKEWNYTDKGYFLFQDTQPKGYDGASGSYAVRVKPLADICREYQASVIEPIGYQSNNLFLTDWEARDVSPLDMQDLYAKFYFSKSGMKMDDKEGTRNVPKDEFEELMMQYLPISVEELQAKVPFDARSKSYVWSPRTMYDYSGQSIPVPEVTKVETCEDGSKLLTVEAVWAEKMTDAAFTHQVRIRETGNDSYQYLSNTVLPAASNQLPDYITRGRDGGEHMGSKE